MPDIYQLVLKLAYSHAVLFKSNLLASDLEVGTGPRSDIWLLGRKFISKLHLVQANFEIKKKNSHEPAVIFKLLTDPNLTSNFETHKTVDNDF